MRQATGAGTAPRSPPAGRSYRDDTRATSRRRTARAGLWRRRREAARAERGAVWRRPRLAAVRGRAV